MVHNDIAAANGVMVDALAARRVNVVVRAEHERARRRIEVERDVVAELTVEGPVDGRAAADEHLVLPACGGARCRAFKGRDAV